MDIRQSIAKIIIIPTIFSVLAQQVASKPKEGVIVVTGSPEQALNNSFLNAMPAYTQGTHREVYIKKVIKIDFDELLYHEFSRQFNNAEGLITPADKWSEIIRDRLLLQLNKFYAEIKKKSKRIGVDYDKDIKPHLKDSLNVKVISAAVKGTGSSCPMAHPSISSDRALKLNDNLALKRAYDDIVIIKEKLYAVLESLLGANNANMIINNSSFSAEGETDTSHPVLLKIADELGIDRSAIVTGARIQEFNAAAMNSNRWEEIKDKLSVIRNTIINTHLEIEVSFATYVIINNNVKAVAVNNNFRLSQQVYHYGKSMINKNNIGLPVMADRKNRPRQGSQIVIVGKGENKRKAVRKYVKL